MDRLYLNDRITESIERMDEAFEGLKAVAVESAKAKHGALFWIYAAEWMAITETATLAGFVL